MSGVEEGSEVSKFAILSPQYLVDLMTRIHDVPKDRYFKRQYSDEHKKLESHGRIDSHALEYVWRDKEVNAEILVQLLSSFNILYPLIGTAEEKGQVTRTEYIIPCMLKSKSEQRCDKRWNKACDRWKSDTDREYQFVFDFGRFLPPALFHYLVVHIYRHSSKTKGITPIMERTSAIFSISNQFLFRLKLVVKDCQIWVYCRLVHVVRLYMYCTVLYRKYRIPFTLIGLFYTQSVCETKFSTTIFYCIGGSVKECVSTVMLCNCYSLHLTCEI